MYLNVINPHGHAYSVDLLTIPLWRLELARWAPNSAEPLKLSTLGIIIRYVTGAVTVRTRVSEEQVAEGPQTVTQTVQIVGLDTGTSGDELLGIVAKGFPHADRADNVKFFREAIGVFHNAIEKATEAEAIIERAMRLVDIRHDILEGLWQPRTEALGALGARLSGSYEGYRYGLVDNRFDAWLVPAGVSELLSGMPGAPTLAEPGGKRRKGS